MKTNFSSNEKESRGLTRVELLTLVATFALLGLLAVPAWSRPGPRPSRTQCLANLRQIALATIQYANEYGNRLPQNPGGNWPIDLPVPVANTMQPFGLTKEILYEPGLQNQNNEILWNFTQQYHVIGYANTFAGTGVLFPANENTSIDSQPVKIAAVWLPAVAPASRVLWADTTMTPAGQNATDPASRASYNYSDLAIGAPQHQRTSHLQAGMPAGCNLAMLDGHVEWRQFADMIPRSAAGINRPFWWW